MGTLTGNSSRAVRTRDIPSPPVPVLLPSWPFIAQAMAATSGHFSELQDQPLGKTQVVLNTGTATTHSRFLPQKVTQLFLSISTVH